MHMKQSTIVRHCARSEARTFKWRRKILHVVLSEKPENTSRPENTVVEFVCALRVYPYALKIAFNTLAVVGLIYSLKNHS